MHLVGFIIRNMSIVLHFFQNEENYLKFVHRTPHVHIAVNILKSLPTKFTPDLLLLWQNLWKDEWVQHGRFISLYFISIWLEIWRQLRAIPISYMSVSAGTAENT